MSALLAPRRVILLGARQLGLIVLLLGLAGVSGIAQSVPSQSVTMQDLTVPKDRLPDGCGLKVIEPSHREVITTFPDGSQRVNFIGPTPSMQPMGVTANPWTGTDRHVLAELRQSVDGYGALRLPDAPPPRLDETSAMVLQFANGVEEGYAATYGQTGRRDLGVWAVKLVRAPEMHLDFPGDTHSPQPTVVVTIGSIRAALFGDAGACSTAIETYLKSLGK